MRNALVIVGVSIISLMASAAETKAAGKAKVAELAAHRIDRLVSLGKIDASFSKKIAKIEVTVLENAAPAYYKVLVSQTQPPQGSPMQVELIDDEMGKTLSFKVIPGGSPGSDPQWPDKDPISLLENSLHYVIDNYAKPEVSAYFNDMTTVTLSKNTYEGQTVAVGTISSSSSHQKMYVYLKLDGTLITTQVAP